MPVTNFQSVISTQSVGTADVQALAASFDKLSGSIDSATAKSKKLNEHPGFEQFAAKVKQGIRDPLGALSDMAEAALLKIGPLGAGVGIMGTAFAAAAVGTWEAAKSLGQYAVQIRDVELRTGLTAKEVGQFGFAARVVGQDVSIFERTMRGLTMALTDTGSQGEKSRAAFRKLGVDVRDSQGEIRPTGELLLDISRALEKIPDTVKRNEILIDLFKRIGIEAAPAILELSRNVERAKEMGLGPTQEEVNRWLQYNERIVEAETRWEKLGRTVKAAFLDVSVTAPEMMKDLAVLLARWGLSKLPNVTTPAPPAAPAPPAPADLATSGASTYLANYLKSSLEGQHAELSRLKRIYDEARTAAEQVATSAKILPEVARKHRDEVETARAAYQRQSDIVKELEKDESKRIANLEKIRDLVRQGQTAYVIGTGATQAIVPGEDVYAANQKPRGIPSLYGGLTPDQIRAGMDVIQGGVTYPAGMQWTPFGAGREGGHEVAFISPSSDRGYGAGEIEQLTARMAGEEEQRKQRNERALASLNQEVDATSRIIELRAGPDGELSAARQVAALRQSAIEEEFRRTQDLDKYRQESQRNELDLTVKIAELQRKRLDELRTQAGALFDSILEGPKGLQDFARNFILGQARTIFQNIAVEVFKGASAHMGLPGKIFAGTIFGQDPLKGATDLNTIETRYNTDAVRDMTAALREARASAMSPSGGGGGFSSAAGTFARMFGGGGSTLSGEQIGLGTADAAGLVRNSAGLIIRGPAEPDINNLPLTHPSATDPSLLYPSFVQGPPSKLAGNIGKGLGYAAAGYGAYQGVSNIARSGAQNVAGGIGELAGAASAIMMLAGATGPAAPIVAGVGMALSLVSSFLGDPKQRRAGEISSWLDARRYSGPDPVSITSDMYGRDISYDIRGNMRPITYQDNRQYNSISAMDAQSFDEYLRNNSTTLNRGVARAIDDGGDLVPKMASALGLQ